MARSMSMAEFGLGGRSAPCRRKPRHCVAGFAVSVLTLVACPLTLAATSSAVAQITSPVSGAAKAAPASAVPAESDGPQMTMDTFLDRLMQAESAGRLTARNPRSTALGPFQFIESTFLAVARRYFPGETQSMTPPQILALRTNLEFSRRAAEAYTKENAAVLQSEGVAATYPNLRLAFLLGAAGAVKVLKAPPDTPLSRLLGPAVLIANPFMITMTARGLAQRSARDIAQPVDTQQSVILPPGAVPPKRTAKPAVSVRCNLRLPSCRRWVALQTAKLRGGSKSVRTAAVTKAGKTAAAGPSRSAARRR